MNGDFVGVEADPIFGPGSDYRPVLPSPLIDAGLPIGQLAWPELVCQDWARSICMGTSFRRAYCADIGAAELFPWLATTTETAVVDAADYVLWRDTFGTMGSSLAADGNETAAVDAGDYDVWKAHFGQSASASGSARPLRSVLDNVARASIIAATFNCSRD